MNDLNWIKELKKKTKFFLEQISEDNFSHIKYSLSGDLYSSRKNWGLGQYVFMSKILYMLDLLKDLKEEEKNSLVSKIRSFQTGDGYISDPLIIKLGFKKKYLIFNNKDNEFEIEKIKRAETRQSFAALNCLDAKPDKPFINVPYSEKEIDNFLSSFDWQFPWDAGSHFSHLMFFLNMNKAMFDYQSGISDPLIDYANNWVDDLQSESDGFWYGKETSLKEKINGAMKVFTGKSAAGINSIRHHEKIIDNCLNAVNDSEACSNFNIIYCLYYCSRISDYRKKEIADFCITRLKIYKDFYFDGIGGFSFNQNRANDIYYNARITMGYNEPDIHGTVMFVWGITLISKILDWDFIDYKVPLT